MACKLKIQEGFERGWLEPSLCAACILYVNVGLVTIIDRGVAEEAFL
jgi:hypothetical protein